MIDLSMEDIPDETVSLPYDGGWVVGWVFEREEDGKAVMASIRNLLLRIASRGDR